MELGAFSVSLAVKDIEVSRSFYEKLGWVVVGKRFAKAKIKHHVMIQLPPNLSQLKRLTHPETPKSILDFLKREMREQSQC